MNWFYKKSPRSFILFVLFLCSSVPTCLFGVQQAAVVMDMHTGKVLHQESAFAKTHPASLTKMMTLYMMFEALESGQLTLDTPFNVSKKATMQMPSKLGLRAGDQITVRNAILSLVTKSANDIAVVVAEGMASSEGAFADQMTKKSRALGLTQTIFKNASGIPDKKQITTAMDMARLSRALYHHFPDYYRYFGTKTFSYKGQKHKNHNKLLGQVRGLDGLKTGFICASGFNIATSAERDGRRLIAVVMGGETVKARDKRVAQLLDTSFAGTAKLPSLIGASTGPMGVPTKPGWSDAAFDQTSTTPKKPNLWSVQVGTYGRAGDAHKAAALSLSKLPDDMNAFVSVKSRSHRRKKMFYAQLDGLNYANARTACSVLHKQKQPCLLLKGKLEPKKLSLIKENMIG